MKMLPFRWRNLKILILGGMVFLAVVFIPAQKNLVADIALRSAVILVLYLPLAYFWKASPEYTGFVNKWVKKVF